MGGRTVFLSLDLREWMAVQAGQSHPILTEEMGSSRWEAETYLIMHAMRHFAIRHQRQQFICRLNMQRSHSPQALYDLHFPR